MLNDTQNAMVDKLTWVADKVKADEVTAIMLGFVQETPKPDGKEDEKVVSAGIVVLSNGARLDEMLIGLDYLNQNVHDLIDENEKVLPN